MAGSRMPRRPTLASSISKKSIRLPVLNNSPILKDSDVAEISDSL
jgi:hypothetical protein